MIIYFIRALLILLLLFVIIVDFDLPIIINTPINQLFIAIIVIFIIITVDEVIGFITGLIFLIIYFKYYQKINFYGKNFAFRGKKKYWLKHSSIVFSIEKNYRYKAYNNY